MTRRATWRIVAAPLNSSIYVVTYVSEDRKVTHRVIGSWDPDHPAKARGHGRGATSRSREDPEHIAIRLAQPPHRTAQAASTRAVGAMRSADQPRFGAVFLTLGRSPISCHQASSPLRGAISSFSGVSFR